MYSAWCLCRCIVGPFRCYFVVDISADVRGCLSLQQSSRVTNKTHSIIERSEVGHHLTEKARRSSLRNASQLWLAVGRRADISLDDRWRSTTQSVDPAPARDDVMYPGPVNPLRTGQCDTVWTLFDWQFLCVTKSDERVVLIIISRISIRLGISW